MICAPNNDVFFNSVKAGNLQDVLLILKRDGDSVVNFRDESICSPIHYAACLDCTDILEVLIAAGANVNTRDEHEWTPLHHAAFDGKLAAVKCLISHGADPLARNDFKTCAEYARDKGHDAIVDYVTPLQFAKQNDWTHRNSVNFPAELQEQVRAFLSAENKGIEALPPEIIETIVTQVAYLQYPRPRARRRSSPVLRGTMATADSR